MAKALVHPLKLHHWQNHSFSDLRLKTRLRGFERMKAGSWYLITFVLTFLYFYIYAVNYVRGASVPTSSLQSSGFHPPSTVAGYVTEEVQVQKTLLNFLTVGKLTSSFIWQRLYRQGRQLEAGQTVQGPPFPRLSMQYHNYTRLVVNLFAFQL